MSILEYIISSARCLAASKMRTFLTALGIIVGISSVILINILGSSLGKTIENVVLSFVNGNLADISINIINDETDVTGYGYYSVSLNGFVGFTDEILNDFEESFDNKIDRIVSDETGISGNIISSDNKVVPVSLTSVSPIVEKTNHIDLIKGRFINKSDVDNKFLSVVIAEQTAKEYFGKEDPIGKQITMTNEGLPIDMTIVGVYKANENVSFMYDNKENVALTAYIPYTVNIYDSMSNGNLFLVSYSIDNIEDATAFKKEATDFMNAYFEKDGYDVTVETVTQYTDKVNEVVKVITTIIAAIAAISLLVGGIGVMNIMLVSVSERTMEIGVRKAMGANNRSIRTQFLTESVMITFLGSFIGVIWGMVLAKITAMLAVKLAASNDFDLSVDLSVPASAIILAVVFSFAIGIIFGVYPAAKASKMEVVDALRYE